VWLVSLERDAPVVLSPDEAVRAARFRFETDRIRWSRARSALRVILAGCTGVDARSIVFELGPNGKPSIGGRDLSDGIEFNLSHSGEWAMVAVTRGVPVGIDLERIRENVDIASLLDKLGEKDLPAGTPTDLYRIWTRREALAKAAGGVIWQIPAGDFRICHVEAPEGYVATVALMGREPEIKLHNELVLPIGTGDSFSSGPFEGFM
jgi:4'-phosphopantetheinyl transferase